MIKFVSNGTTSRFGPGSNTVPSAANGDEWQRLLHVFGIIEAATHDPNAILAVSNGITPKYLEDRFFAYQAFLLPEKEGLDCFPDAVLVGDQCVVAIDFCRVDASDPILKNGKCHGTTLQRGLKGKPLEEHPNCPDLEIWIQENGITFCTRNLAESIARALHSKNIKSSQYGPVIRPYLISEDRRKPIETWIVLEDLTPTSDFDIVESTITRLEKSLSGPSGIIYVHDNGPLVLPDSILDLKFFRLHAGNDSSHVA
ncbi:MAG: hypothetical protein Q4B77_07355 [Coriobacteriaceae bacterium]|nr:hypothetical protein [Coriobacteriaceae bacterium]